MLRPYKGHRLVNALLTGAPAWGQPGKDLAHDPVRCERREVGVRRPGRQYLDDVCPEGPEEFLRRHATRLRGVGTGRVGGIEHFTWRPEITSSCLRSRTAAPIWLLQKGQFSHDFTIAWIGVA